ncbi:MAG TPA: ATP-binding protein [Thermoanaerobaculia bacterium]|nr:ATP-binding protein [Thermoanaerobaculia bacterium]
MNLAQRITAPAEGHDAALEPQTRSQIEDLVGLGQLKPGFRALFSGPPGTGQTPAAALLGKAAGLPVFRIDLSQVFPEWTEETEQSLASLFAQAEFQGWVLFFDEADLLFDKRTESRNASDRAANQQIAYLLQRIEDFPGIVILAADLRSHLDEAFVRRFQHQQVLHFPLPG